jgi:hypothetical protein
LRSHLNFPYISWPLTKIAYILTSHLVLSILCFFYLLSNSIWLRENKHPYKHDPTS